MAGGITSGDYCQAGTIATGVGGWCNDGDTAENDCDNGITVSYPPPTCTNGFTLT